MDTITITVAENDPDVIVSATLNEDAVTITLNEAAVGATGPGVPTGGATNDILKKTSATNYATGWETPTSAATASTIVRRDASGGAAFDDLTAATVVFTGSIQSAAIGAIISTTGNGASITTEGDYASIGTNGIGATITTGGTDSAIATIAANSPIYTIAANSPIYTAAADSDITTQHASASVKSYNFAALDATAGASLRNSAGTAYLTWGATAGNISITVDTTSTGHFFSNPSTVTAGHFLTKNGTAPTIVAGRSAWFSNGSGDPQFRNGTGSAVTLVYSGGALGTPSSGTLTSCTGLPISTGVSGLGTGVATFLATPGTGVATALAINVGTAGSFVVNGGALGTPNAGTLTSCTGLPVSTGISGLGTGVATLLGATPSGTGGVAGTTAPTFATSITVGGSNATGVIVATTNNAAGSISIASLLAASSTGDVYFTIGKALTNTNSALIGYSTVGGGGNPYAFLTTYGRAASDLCVNVLGNVGMGTATPAYKLSVSGIASATGGFLYGTYTVGTFPSTTYLEAVVTDALTPVVGATVAAGGSAKCKVTYNGSAKIVTAVL